MQCYQVLALLGFTVVTYCYNSSSHQRDHSSRSLDHIVPRPIISSHRYHTRITRLWLLTGVYLNLKNQRYETSSKRN